MRLLSFLLSNGLLHTPQSQRLHYLSGRVRTEYFTVLDDNQYTTDTINWSMVTCQGITRYWNCLEVYGPCAGGLSAVNAIGTQLRNPINPGLAQWSMAV